MHRVLRGLGKTGRLAHAAERLIGCARGEPLVDATSFIFDQVSLGGARDVVLLVLIESRAALRSILESDDAPKLGYDDSSYIYGVQGVRSSCTPR